ncbi:PR domain zinc finger protein 10-like [Saccostrea echinata]|uniref:PR domain zinc finger protein 10-like n=1 Tax=Saccostrea echinata TaxID=191078 RepID=UPI002A82010C|nr:PR domain zinc finger protein 10-like [Saccostrea echinata]
MTTKHEDQWHHDLMTKGGFHQVYDNDIPSRARLTCPPGLSIKAVKDHEGRTTSGVFAKKIVQVRTRFGPMLAPVKNRTRSETPRQPANVDGQTDSLQNNPMTTALPSSSLHSQVSVGQQGDKSSLSSTDQMLQSVNRSIQEVAIDRNNVEHQDIVQQALGIVKLSDDHHTPGPFGDASTTLSETIHLATSLASETMAGAGQFTASQIGDDLSLTVPIESTINPSVTEGLTLTATQAQSLLAHMDSSTFPSVTSSGAMMANQQDILNSVVTEPSLLAQTSEAQVVGVVKNALQGVVNDMINEVSSTPVQPIKEEVGLKSNPADQPFVVKVFHDDGYEDELDLSDEDKCNWMMFVRPARTAAEQNVVVCQHQNQIFFVSTKPIPSNTEIRVWYEAEYAKLVQKELLPELEGPPNPATGYPSKWACSVCLEGFNTFNDLEAHNCAGEPPADKRQLRGRPRKGRPRKYVKPSKTWRARLEKSRLPPRKRGRPPKLKGMLTVPRPPKEVKISVSDPPLEENNLQEVMDNPPELVDDDPIDKDDHDVSALELLDEVLGEDDEDDIPVLPRRRGRKKRAPGAPKITRTPKREPMACPHCEETFTKEALFVIHVSEHTGVKPYICEVPECQKGFMSKFKLERHRLIHTCPRSHKCLYCDKSFNRKDHLKNHMVTHDPNKKRWVCEECGKEYCYNFSYRTHKAFHDADAGRTTECGICHKQYESKDELLYHLKVHSGARSVKNCTEKTHACDDCGKTFYTRKDVRRHMITHTKKKDFLCQYCPQRFGRKDHLTRHLRSSHTGDNNNSRPRAPRAERKEKQQYTTANVSMVGLQIPRDEQNLLVASQPMNYQQLQAFASEIPVPLQMFENSGNQTVIAMPNMGTLQTQQQTQQQPQQPQQQQQQPLQVAAIQNVQHVAIQNQMPVAENRYVEAIIRHQPQQNIVSSTPTEYRTIEHQPNIQTYIPVATQQPQQQQQQPQQHIQIAKTENIDLTRTNGVLQTEFVQTQATRNDMTARPTVLQAADVNRQGNAPAQTFSTLLGYMETLRFLENLPTNAQGAVISQMTMQQDGQPLPTMVPIQTSTLAYSVATTATPTHQIIPVEMQTKRMAVTQHSAYQQQGS